MNINLHPNFKIDAKVAAAENPPTEITVLILYLKYKFKQYIVLEKI